MSNSERDGAVDGQGPEDIDVHVIAMTHFARALAALNAAMEHLEALNKGEATEVKERAAEVRRAMQSVFDERKRSDSIAQRDGDDRETDGEIDLDRARTEIQRRLARIRGSEDAG